MKRSRKRSDGVIYFAQAGESGHVKIGHTGAGRCDRRVATLQTGCPETLTVRARILRATLEDETRLHTLFSRLRVRGEWFRAEEELVYFMQEANIGYWDNCVPMGGCFFPVHCVTPSRRDPKPLCDDEPWVFADVYIDPVTRREWLIQTNSSRQALRFTTKEALVTQEENDRATFRGNCFTWLYGRGKWHPPRLAQHLIAPSPLTERRLPLIVRR